MTKVIYMVVQFVCALSTFFMICLLPGKYSWVSDYASSISPGSFIDQSANSNVVIALIFIFVMTSQVILFVKYKSIAKRVFCIIFGIIALVSILYRH